LAIAYFKHISEYGYAPQLTASNIQIITRKESHASYRKYHLKNRENEKMRPFYKWKEGFIDGYIKKCSPEALARRAVPLTKWE